MLARASCFCRSSWLPYDDHEIWTEREDPLEIRIEQRPDPLQLLHFRRVLVEAADRDHLRPRAHRKEDLRHGGNQRDDPLRP